MKKAILFFLCLMLICTAFASVISATDSSKSGDGNTLVDVDFASIYKTLGYTESTAFDSVLNSLTGMTPINYQFSEGTLGAGNCYYNLTADGLDIDNVFRRYAGIVISSDAYKDINDYYVTITMDTSYEHYLYFGWGYNATAADGTYNGIIDAKVGTNFRHDGTNTANKVIMNGGFAAKSGSPSDLYYAEVIDGNTAKYTFVVKDKSCKEVIIDCNGVSVDYVSEIGVDASAGYFGIFVRTASKDKESGVLIKNIDVVKGDYVPDAGDTARTLPAEVEKAYTDTAETKYKPGYVLHYMDFSKVTSFENTGYFITNDSTPSSMAIEDGFLKVKSTGGTYMLFTSNGIPKNIQDYTVEIKFKFEGTDSSYMAFLQSIVLDEKSCNSKNFNTCIRYSGVVDSSEAIDAEKWPNIVKSYQAGELLTFTYIAMERYTYQITVSCGDDSVAFVKNQNTLASPDTYMGIMFGYGSAIDIASVKITAGRLKDFESNGYIWPNGENELVRNVSINALDSGSADTTENTDNTAQATDTTAVSPVTQGQPGGSDTSTTGGSNKGCKSSIGAAAATLLTVTGVLSFCLRKSKER